MAKTKGNEMTVDYDEIADVLNVSFGTGEPSFSEEIDDLVVVDFGMYTGAPTGFQVLHVKETGINEIQVILEKKLPELVDRKAKSLKAVASEREHMLKEAFHSFSRRAEDLISV
jgi:hypothetical protein